jgi:uncharacterized protein (TIGR02001 family)
MLLRLIFILFLSFTYTAWGAEKKSPHPSTGSSPKNNSDTVSDDDDDDDTEESKAPKKAATLADKDEDSDDADDDDDDSAEEEGRALSGNVTLASDYILHGLSQTEHEPAVQGGFDWEHPKGFYLGVWGSTVHFNDLPSSLELDTYGGYAYQFNKDWKTSLGAMYSSYWADGSRNGWGIPLKTQFKGFSLEIDYSPRWQGQDVQNWYFLAGWQDYVIAQVKLGFFVGYSDYIGPQNDPGYADYQVTASREFFGVEWAVSGVFTNTQVINQAEGGDRAVFSVTKTF